MVRIGLIDVDETKYPNLNLKEYMRCQSKAFSVAVFSCFVGGGAGYIGTKFIPKVYPSFNKNYNLFVIAGGAIVTSYLVAHHLTKQCQRRFLVSGSSSLPPERHFSKKVEVSETMIAPVHMPSPRTIDTETIHELHKGVGKRV